MRAIWDRRRTKSRVIASMMAFVFLMMVIVPAYGSDAGANTASSEASGTVAPAPPAAEEPAAEEPAAEEAPAAEAEEPEAEAPAAEAEEPAAEEPAASEAPAEPEADKPAAAEPEVEEAVVAPPVHETIFLTGGLDMLEPSDGGFVFGGDCGPNDTLLWHFVVTGVDHDPSVDIDLNGTIVETRETGGVFHVYMESAPDAVLFPDDSTATAWFKGNGNPQFNLSDVTCITGGEEEVGSKICVHKFEDLDESGDQNDDEQDLSGFTFTLFGLMQDGVSAQVNGDGEWIELGTVTTGEDGHACFGEDFPSGLYKIVEDVPEGWMPTTDNPAVFVHNGEEDQTIEFGDVKPPEEEGELEITKSADVDEVSAGDTINYTITVMNNGEEDCEDVLLVDDYDQDSVTITDDGGATDDGDKLTWPTFDLPAGEEMVFHYTAMVDEDLPENVDEICNTATVTCGEETEEAELCIPVVVTPPISGELEVTKSADKETVAPGGTITYTIVVTNSSNVDLENVLVTDDFDEALVSVTNAGGGTVADGKIVWTIPMLESGASETFTYSVLVDTDVANGTIIRNTVVVKSGEQTDTASEEVKVVVAVVTPTVEVIPGAVTAPITTTTAAEEFLPFTGAEASLLAMAAAVAGGMGLTLRRRSRRMRNRR